MNDKVHTWLYSEMTVWKELKHCAVFSTSKCDGDYGDKGGVNEIQIYKNVEF